MLRLVASPFLLLKQHNGVEETLKSTLKSTVTGDGDNKGTTSFNILSNYNQKAYSHSQYCSILRFQISCFISFQSLELA